MNTAKLTEAQVQALKTVQDGMFLTASNTKRTVHSANITPRMPTIEVLLRRDFITFIYRGKNGFCDDLYDIVLTAKGREAMGE